MSQANISDKQIRMNAPTYMRPQRSVLDEPLDIDAGKRITAQPRAKEIVEEIPTPVPAVTAETPVETATVVETAPDPVEVLVESIPEMPAEAQPAPEPVVEQATEPEIDTKPRRKQMTVFQQVIVLLLLLVIAAFLATVLLYTNGWIELPVVVLNVIEKGLSLIQ